MTGLRTPPTTRNSGLTPSARNAPDNNTYRKYYKRNNGATWAVVTLSEWRQLILYDLWQVYPHLWGARAPRRMCSAKTTFNDKPHPHSNIRDMNQAETWGERMRYWPNGWHTKGLMARYAEWMTEAEPGKNSITRSDGSQKNLAWNFDDWQPSQRGDSDCSKYFCSTPLIKHFMPADVIPYHIAWKDLPFSHQAILWVHYASDVDYIRKLHLLKIDSDSYQNLLTLAQHKIEQTICELPDPAPEPPEPKPGTGPLWSCRIFARVHKWPIRHAGANTLHCGPVLQFPVSLSWAGFRLPIAEDENDNYVFRLPGGEIYALLSKRVYNCFLPEEAMEFLELARAIMNSNESDRTDVFERDCIRNGTRLLNWRKSD